MRRPHNIDCVSGAMKPVEKKIYKQIKNYETVPTRLNLKESEMKIDKFKDVINQNAYDKVDGLIADGCSEACD